MKRDYPDRPFAAVGVIICQDDRIVLIQRDSEPSRGRWTFPGGAIELGESLRDAARREAVEETGLQIEVGEVAAVLDSVVLDDQGRVRYHYVIVDYLARPTAGTLAPGSDVAAARWVGLADLDELAMTEKAQQIARRLLSGRPRQDPAGC